MNKEMKVKTRPLTNYEQNVLLPILVKALRIKKGKKNAVTAKQMVSALQSHGLKLHESNVCRIVNYIRMNDLIVGLMASSAGYYIISSEQDFIRYEYTLMSREAALRRLRMRMERQRTVLFKEHSHMEKQLF